MAEQHPVDAFSINKNVLMGKKMRTRARARILPRERLRKIIAEKILEKHEPITQKATKPAHP